MAAISGLNSAAFGAPAALGLAGSGKTLDQALMNGQKKIAAFWPKIKPGFLSGARAIWSQITRLFTLNPIQRAIARMVTGIVGGFRRLGPRLIAGLKGAWQGVLRELQRTPLGRAVTRIVSGVVRTFQRGFRRLPQVARAVWSAITRAFMASPLVRAVTGIVSKITGTWGKLRTLMPRVAQQAWAGIRRAWNASVLGRTINTVVSAVERTWQRIRQSLPKTATEAWALVVKTFQDVPIIGAVVKLVDGIVKKWDEIRKIKDAVVKWFGDTQKEIQGWGPKFAAAAAQAGQQLVDGLVKYLQGTAVGRVVTAAARLANAAVQGFKKGAEIGSPSRVFMRLGKDTADGYIAGLRQNERRVADAARRTFGAAAKAAQQIMRGSGAGAAAFAGGRVRMQRDPSGALIPQGSGRGATNLRGLANQISSTSRTATSEVARLLGNIRRQITQGMRRGATGSAMQGLRRAATVVTAEFTQRNKALMARLKEQSAALKRGRTAIERGLRRRGVDIASEDGFKAMQAYSKELVDQLTRQAAALRKQMMAARRAGARDVAATTRKKLFEVKDQLEETVTQMAEGARRAAAGDFGQYGGQRDSEGSYAEESDDRERKREARREKAEEKKQAKEEARREKKEARRELEREKAEAQKEWAEAMKELSAEILASRQWAQRMASVEEGTLRRALADVLSGEIAGAGFRPRAASAGVGSVARF
jgi:hypothetical protein